MKWQPIDTAPPNKMVEIGMWEKNYYSPYNLIWRTQIGVARRTSIILYFFRFQKITCDGERFTHWRDLPEPPEDK